MYTGSLSKFDVLTFGESEIKSRGGVSFTPKRSKSKHLFFKGTYLERADENIWRKNGMASYFSHMAPRIVRVCIFYLIPLYIQKLIILMQMTQAE